MRRFNPNAYGNPLAKTSSDVHQSTDHTAEEKHDYKQPVKQQEIVKPPITSVTVEKFPPNIEKQPVQSSSVAELEPNRSRNKAPGTLYDSKYCPDKATLKSGVKKTSLPHKHSTSEKSKTVALLAKSDVSEIAHGPEIYHDLPQPTRGPPEFKDQSVNSLIHEPATSSRRLMHEPAVSIEEQANGGAVRDRKLPISTREHLQTMATSGRSASVHSQTTMPVPNRSGNPITVQEQLALARGDALKQISLQNRARQKGATTSLRDLDLARRPVTGSIDQSMPKREQSQPDARPVTFNPTQAPPSFDPRNGSTPSVDNNNNVGHAPVKKRVNSSNFDKRKRQKAQSGLAEDAPSSWMSRAALEPVEMDVESNAWGSSIPSNASQASKDSVQPLHSGKALQRKDQNRLHPLAGWDGNIQPPPADWNDRPRFNNDSPEFHDDFARWNKDVSDMTHEADDSMFKAIPVGELERDHNRPDGINMVPKNMTINHQNARRYGYEGEDVEEILKYSRPIDAKDFEDWGKLDMRRPENIAHEGETTENLISNWKYHTEQRRKSADAQMESDKQAVRKLLSYRGTTNPNRPILNIYLRPACRADIWQMAQIYNWYIENGPRPAETLPIQEEDMETRLEDVQGAKLPFIVAIERNMASGIPYNHEVEAEATRNNPHPIKNIDRTQKGVTIQEKIVGWACATDLTARDYVERISVELEIFVDPAYRQLGVGKCLMDKLLESCDRGYMKQGGYPFHCPLEFKHLYNTGGGRDLHKLTFLVRKWKYPQDVVGCSVVQKHVKANPKRKTDDLEKDYDMWLRKWLESWGFEVEGVMKGAGAKNGRFVDVVHLGRETKWQPAEGKIPDPVPGTY